VTTAIRPDEDELEPIFIRHKTAMRLLAIRDAKYWQVVKAGKITTVGQVRSSRAYLPSVLAYAAEILAEARSAAKTTS
jgi:hypothetical protein